MKTVINIDKVNVKVNININDMCKFKPTEIGWQVLKQKVPHYKECMGFKDDGYFTTELWDFMSIFGEHMYNGGKQVIEENSLEFEST